MASPKGLAHLLTDADNALRKARARALEKGDTGDAEQLGALGIVVREESEHQYWRWTG